MNVLSFIFIFFLIYFLKHEEDAIIFPFYRQED